MRSAKGLFVGSVLAAAALAGLLWWLAGDRPASAPERALVVFCAAGLKPPVEAVAREYQSRHGVPIQLQYGGSGTLLSNLRIAGSGDLFIAADQSYMEIARAQGLVAEIIPLATQTPVIAVHQGNPKRIRDLTDLLDARVRVALANPDAAAVGKATRDLFVKLGSWAEMERKVKVFKPTVSDVANDIILGAVDAGIVWDATVRQYPALEAVPARVPAMEEAGQRVEVGVLVSCSQPAAALRFARYLGARDRGLKEMAGAGYRVVEGDVWAERPEVVFYSGGVNRLAIDDTLNHFERREGVRVTRVYNGCGILVSQMKTGQQPDAYLACDVSFLTPVKELFGPGMEVSETDIVILVAKGNPHGVRSLKDLAKQGLRVGLANAEQSTLGELTAQLLKKDGIYSEVMVNVRTQTPTADLLVNQMRTGALDAVVVYEVNTSQVRSQMEVVPLQQPGAKAVQPYAVGRKSDHALLMERLRAAIRSPESRKRYESLGFRWRE